MLLKSSIAVLSSAILAAKVTIVWAIAEWDLAESSDNFTSSRASLSAVIACDCAAKRSW